MGGAPDKAASSSSRALHLVLAAAELRPSNAHCAGGGGRHLRVVARWQVAGVWTLPVQPDPLMRAAQGG
eukprot:8135313-Lingulodinium_polyedra.AAC.1